MNFAKLGKFLFYNIGHKQTILKNIFWLAIGEGSLRLSAFLILIFAGRILGPTEFGKFAFALAVVSLFAVLSDFGLFDIVIRDFSRNQEEQKEFFAVLSLKTVLSVGTLLLICGASFFVASDSVVRTVIWLVGGYFIFNGFIAIFCAFFRARMLMEYEALVKTLQAIFVTAVGLYILFNFPSAINLSYGYLLSSFCIFLFVLFLISFRVQRLKVDLDINAWKKFFGRSWSLGFAMIFGVIYIYIDSVMLGFWGQITEVGWYNAAYRIIGIPLVAMTLISMGFYPALSKFIKESKENLSKFWDYQMEIMIVLAVPLAAGGIVTAPQIINFFYGASYSPSIGVFRLLILAAAVNFLFNPYNMALIIADQQKKHLWICFITALLNIVLNLVLIPKYSFYGAGLATLVSYIVLFILEVEFSRRFTPIAVFNLKLAKVLFMAILSSAAMIIIIRIPFIYYSFNFIGLFLSGATVYFSVLFLLLKLLKKTYAHINS